MELFSCTWNACLESLRQVRCTFESSLVIWTWNLNLRSGKADSSKEASGSLKNEASSEATGVVTFFCRSKDDNTVTTAAESLEDVEAVGECLGGPSKGGSECGTSEWSIVVNDTHYFGHLLCSEKRSVSSAEDLEFLSYVPQAETPKERERRLLHQDREARQRAVKLKTPRGPARRHRKQECVVQAIDEEENECNTCIDTVEGGEVSAKDVPEKKDAVADDERKTRIKLIMRKRHASIRRCKRSRARIREKVKGRTCNLGKMRDGSWGAALLMCAKVVRLYSCSASRYASLFRSNRRFKPGD